MNFAILHDFVGSQLSSLACAPCSQSVSSGSSARSLRSLVRMVSLQRERVDRLRQEIDALRSDPRSRERIAREQLGYVKPGEKLFLLPETPATGDDGDPNRDDDR